VNREKLNILEERLEGKNSHRLKFTNSLGVSLSTNEVVFEMVKFMAANTTKPYKVTIGSDSQIYKNLTTDFVSAIVVHRIGNGGRYFWRRIVSKKKFYSLHDRMLEEVMLSLSVAKEFLAECERENIPQFDFEIHVDIGSVGETNTMIQELVGMIRAHNFEAKTKPESYAASNIADRRV